MKIAILSRRKSIYSTRRLVEASEKRGHQAEVINTLRCNMNITTSNPGIFCAGKALTDYDAVIPRIGASIAFYGAALVRQFEMMGVYCVNDSVSITRARDKLRSLQLLCQVSHTLQRCCLTSCGQHRHIPLQEALSGSIQKRG